MKKVILVLALGASALAGTAVAQTAPDTPPPPPRMGGAAMMMRADANHDGVVTRAEAIAEADARFAQMDANHDGRIGATEMADYRQAMHDRMIASGHDAPPPPPPPGGGKHAPGMGRHADPDGDGSISLAEFEARAAKRFDRMDANHDGRIDRTEMANMAEMHHERREQKDGMTPPPPPPGE